MCSEITARVTHFNIFIAAEVREKKKIAKVTRLLGHNTNILNKFLAVFQSQQPLKATMVQNISDFLG